MGLEALHFLSVSSPRPPLRPFLPGDVGLDGMHMLLTRRVSDVSDCINRGSSCRKRQAASKASMDEGGPSPGFPHREPRSSEKELKRGPSSSFLRSEALRTGQGFPESRLFRWNSDGTGLRRVVENFPGDEWWRADDDDLREVGAYSDLERFEMSSRGVVVDPSFLPGVLQARRAALLKTESQVHESQRMTGCQEQQNWSSAEVSAVDVTAPSFVVDKKFVDRTEHLRGIVVDRQEAGSANQLTDGMVSSIGRPASVDRKAGRKCTLQGHSNREGLMRTEKAPLGLGERAAFVSIPDSLRNLKKRNGRGRATGGGVSAIKKAFDSMVEMIRALQSYTLQMPNILVPDTDVHQLLYLVHREMHSSFLWLFQQVFSCTPALMVSVMILLANFTVHSLGDTVAMGAVASADSPTHLESSLQAQVERDRPTRAIDCQKRFAFVHVNKSLEPFLSSSTADDSAEHGFGNYGSGGIGRGSVLVGGGEYGDYSARGSSDRSTMFSREDSVDLMQPSSTGCESSSVPRENIRPVFASKVQNTRSSDGVQPLNEEGLKSTDGLAAYQTLLELTARELELKPGEPFHYVQLDQETLRLLVSPVATKMESDNYPCFDRTDLEYQHAITTEPTNPMLLANYAQFLYAVRHDNTRAEGYFRQALKADSKDGDIVGRWASFLWLALQDRPQAEIAYRSALVLDPSNPYHAGSYAHFLWHAGDDEPSSCIVEQAY